MNISCDIGILLGSEGSISAKYSVNPLAICFERLNMFAISIVFSLITYTVCLSVYVVIIALHVS